MKTELTQTIIGCAIEVHKALGPGLLESAYQECLLFELKSKDLNVKKGQKVKKGQVIGTVGKTGRSTGPHLDIRLNWFDVKLDPASVLKLK